jgi:hypothetical protein
MIMSFSYDFTFTVSNIIDIEPVMQQINPKPVKQIENSGITFTHFEVWSPQGGTMVIGKDLQAVGANSKSIASSFTHIDASNEDGTVSVDNNIKHPWFNPLSPYIHYRTNPVFMVPSHHTLSQLALILLDSPFSFKVRALTSRITQAKPLYS